MHWIMVKTCLEVNFRTKIYIALHGLWLRAGRIYGGRECECGNDREPL